MRCPTERMVLHFHAPEGSASVPAADKLEGCRSRGFGPDRARHSFASMLRRASGAAVLALVCACVVAVPGAPTAMGAVPADTDAPPIVSDPAGTTRFHTRHGRLLSSIDRKILALSRMALQALLHALEQRLSLLLPLRPLV
jgi:hypothetical protein